MDPETVAVHVHGRLRGHMQWQLVNADGTVAQAGEQSNLILDRGMDIFGTNTNHATTSSTQALYGSWRTYLAVGTSSTAPAVGQTALGAEVMRGQDAAGLPASNTYSVTNGVMTGAFKQTRVLDFAASFNLTEWGLSDVSTAGGLICIRELFRDGNGGAITLSVQAGQQLQLTHTLNIQLTYAAGAAASFDLTGVGTLQGQATWFTAGSTSALLDDMFGSGFNPAKTGYGARPLTTANTGAPDALGGSAAASADSISMTLATYTTGSFTRTRTASWNTGNANYAHYGWIFGSTYTAPYAGFKFSLTNPASFVKTSANKLTLNLKLTWGRA